MINWQGRQRRHCKSEKEQSHLYRSPDRQVGESQGGLEPHLGEKERGLEREHWKESVDSKIKEARFQEGEGKQAKRAS